MKKLRVGITGPIGSGKTAVAGKLADFGAPVVDVDEAGRWAVEKKTEVRAQIAKEFGTSVFLNPDEIDRKKLGLLVFADEKKLQKLNSIVHPHMLQRVRDLLKLYEKESKFPYIIVDAALVFELDLDRELDVVVTVSAPEEFCKKRTFLRDRLSEAEFHKRLESQLPLSEKISRSHYVLNNDSSLKELERKIIELHNWLLQRAE